jgi:peptide/nickel transport system permease protein
MIGDGRAFYSTAWWIAGGGGLFVMVTVLCANLIGEALEEAFDPKGTR